MTEPVSLSVLLAIVLRRVSPGLWGTRALPVPMELAGWDMIDVDLGGDRVAALRHLAEAGTFPDYFGHNLDAAYDCMTDLSWRARCPRVMVVRGRIDPGLFAVLADASRYWAHSDTPLWVVVDLLANRPETTEEGGVPSLDRLVPPLSA
jgi:hypothetical protein